MKKPLFQWQGPFCLCFAPAMPSPKKMPHMRQ
jgi:hypothetical protein